ncbi:MAG: SPFH domain-containing protein [Gaiellales bacterium]|nr:SPFH domain-containing protein [Gaiellales bacterium]
MALMDLIELVDQAGNEMVHRIPEKGSGEFRIGSQLIVRENQWAVFYRDGKALDVFEAGRHTLSTLNIPILTSVLAAPLFGDSPFRSEVYFVTQSVFTDLKWGTAEPILFRDSEFKMIRLRSHGIYTMQIVDPKLFVEKLVGTRAIYTNAAIEDFLRGIIVGRLADLLGENLDTVLDLPRYFDELGAGLKARTKEDFYQYGVSIVDFVINAITPPEEVQKRIDERSGMEAVGGMDKYFQFKAAQALGNIGAGGPGGAGGGDLGNVAAAGLGLGAGAGLGMMLPGMLQNAMAQGAQPKMRCPNCSKDIPADSKFCPECGHNLQATVTCAKCGAVQPASSKFCTNCGNNLAAPVAPAPQPAAEASPADGPAPAGQDEGSAGGQAAPSA